MKQPATFEDLQALGTEKIHERTHISRDKVELILSKSYGEIGRVQFMGYMSILEREYGIDLSEIKDEYTKLYQDHIASLPPKESVILQSSSNSKPKWIVVGIILIITLMIAGYIAQSKMSNEPREEVMKLSVPPIALKDSMIDTNGTDTNETNVTAVVVNSERNSTKATISQPMISGKGLIIHPIYKVWYGMIDMATGKRIQKITTDAIPIDTTKNWLIFLGHGRLEVESSSGKIEYKQMDPIRFMCENGVLKELNKDEFIAHNGGQDW